jgi:hypothetical protein
MITSSKKPDQEKDERICNAAANPATFDFTIT